MHGAASNVALQGPTCSLAPAGFATMDQQHAFGNINVSTFDGLLQQYPNVVPEKVAVLEEQRLNVIPKAVKEREPAFLTKPELVTLVDWKL